MIYSELPRRGQGTSFASHQPEIGVSSPLLPSRVNRGALARVTAQLAVVVCLVILAALNIHSKTWTHITDGVYWENDGSNVVASTIVDGPAQRAGVRRGDTLLSINERLVATPQDVVTLLHASREGDALRYAVIRSDGPGTDLITLTVTDIPTGAGWLYIALAGVGLFTLLVGTSVRLRRPENQATLHFFWLSVAFFGILTFSYSGKFDLLDWVFYWGDVVAMLLLDRKSVV